MSRPGEAGQRFGLAAWGFSPDAENASLAYLFNVENGVSLNLVNLPRRRQVINGWSFEGTAEVRFSPCGDLLSLVRYPAQAAEVWLERTLDGSHAVSGASVANFGFLEAQPDFHVARTGSGTVHLLANAAALDCVEIPLDAPYWPDGAKLTATAVRPTSLRLVRPTARSNGGRIVAYEIRQDAPAEQVLGTLTPGQTEFTVQELAPETEYRFSVRARNEAELWSPEPLTVTVKTAKPNAAPAWPLDARLAADQVLETSLHLEWPAAVDDAAVTAHRVFQDGAVLATLDAQKRGHYVSNLVIGQSYEFRVQARDALDQWSTDGPWLRIATRDVTPPTWPAGSRLYAAERQTHRLVLEWTPAQDNVEVDRYGIHLIERGSARLHTLVDGGTTNFALSCLLPGQRFEFAVEAGDAAGNWTTGGPRAWLSTVNGPNECVDGLELASVSSGEQPTRGVLALGWADDGQYWHTADSESPALSADGRYVVFHSTAINLVAGDGNNAQLIFHEGGGFDQFWCSDIFVRDRWAGTTERVSTRGGGGEADVPGSSHDADISGDGRFIVFRSSAADLAPPDRNGKIDIFVRDRRHNTLRRLTSLAGGNEADGHSGPPRISADGAVVVFASDAGNLTPDDANGVADIFAIELASGRISRVSVASDGTPANAASWGAAVSGDGRFVAFGSDASNLVPADQNNAADVFVHDRATGQTTRISVSSTGGEANGHSGRTTGGARGETRPALSIDGRFVAFDSVASNLVPGDANACRDVFVHDRETGQTTRVSLTSGGLEGPPPTLTPLPQYAFSWAPDISGDGRRVVFLSKAALVPEKRTIVTDVFLHDRQTGETRRVSACTCGGDTEPNHAGARGVAISRDGRVLAFDSDSANIKPGLLDANWSHDVFVFAPETSEPDQDGDGAPDAEEMGPAGNDPLHDGDGVPDHLQDHVTARHTRDGRHYFWSRVVDRQAIAGVTPVDPPDLTGLPAGVALPLGAFTVQAFGAVEPGGEIVIQLEFPEGIPFNSYYKHGARPDSPSPRWYEFLYDGRTGAEIDGHRVTLHLVDGERGDLDLLADGNLLDPGGPALVGAAPAPKLTVEPSQVALEGNETETAVLLTNSGGRPLVWAVTDALPTWLRAGPARGELEPGQAATLTLKVDRSGLAAGAPSHNLRIHSGGGTRGVAVTLEVLFALDARAELTGPCLVLAWRCEPGAAYRVQFTDSLSSPDWRDASEIIIASGMGASWTDCRGQAAGRFYRVVQVE